MRLPTSVLGNLASLCGLLLIATTVSAQWPQRNAVDIATHSQRGRCEPGYWKCRSGQCVPNSYRCNGRYECIDYSDEEACRSATQPARRQQVRVQVHPERLSVRAGDDVVINCRSSSGDLRSLRWTKVGGPLPRSAQDVNGRLTLPSAQPNDAGTYVCTSREGNGVVEAQATVQVAPSGPLEQRLGACDPRSQKTCQNGDCVNIADVCNGVRDCRDGSDEDNCGGSSEGCEPNEMRCNNGRCVQKMWVCDGDDDCGDRSDESSCRQKAPGEICHPYEFQCGNQRQCVPASFHCDGQNDCQDGSDEVGCREPEVVEPPPPSKQVFVGEVITLECRALGVPAPHISWRKNWGHVCPPPRCTQTSVDGKGILTIRNSITGDSGAYTCEAINIRGRVLAVPDCIVDVRPRQSRCNADGTARTRPDGSCECKEFVVGELCDRCQANSFWLNAANPQGCLRCFCSGVTRDCSSSSWYRSEERFTPSASQLTSLKVTNSRGQPEDNSGVSVGQRGELTYSGRPRSTAYISLPQNVIGDKITAYGGNIEYTVTYSGRGSPNNDAVLILKGNEITLLHRPTSQLSADRPNAVRVPVYETSFTREDGQPCTREHLLMTLADLEGFMIKLTYVSDQSSVSISDVKFDIAINRDTQQERAWAVEECRCPEGYIGLSCQDCAPGYERSGGGLYLGTCEKQQPKPQGRCDPVGTLREENGRCICKANVRGQYCNECTPETFFLDARNPKGCIDCFCSGVTRFCESSDMYRIQISQDYAREGPSGLKVRTKDYNPPVYGRGAVQPAGGRVQFTSFQDAPAGKAFYWELPSFFHGDRVTAYGGGIKYKVSFSGDGAENREPDVVIKGNDIVLYYYHWAGIEPDMDQQVTVNIFEANWRLPDGNLASRPQLMMALSDLDSILLKMSYRADMRTASLLEASMDISKKGRTIQERALAVEVCECPEGYMGSSCEDCSPGFTRNTQGNQYLGTCQRGGQPVVRCNCNGHSDTCDASGRCLSCQHNTVGFSCGDCAPGYYGQVRGRPDDCQKCPCPPGVSCSLDSRRQVQCQCPPPKTGPRCDQCGPGYSKDPRDPRVCRPVGLSITVDPSSQSVPAGSNAEFKCFVDGNVMEKYDIGWSKPGQNSLPANAVASKDGRLAISGCTRNDAGEYLCTATPIAPSDPALTTMTAKGKLDILDKPDVRVEPPTQNIPAGNDATFTCKVVSPNAADYKTSWSRPGFPSLPPNARDQGNGVLTIGNAADSNSGRYHCDVTPIDPRSGLPKHSEPAQLGVNDAPKVMVKPPYQDIPQGNNAEFRCSVSGSNAPHEYSWKRVDSDQMQSNAQPRGQSLVIERVTLANVGQYQCEATPVNPADGGPISGIGRLASSPAPKVMVDPPYQTVPENTPATFRCTVPNESQYDLTWSKLGQNGQPLNANRGILSFPAVRQADVGEYLCTATPKNPDDKSPPLTGSGRLDIAESPRAYVEPPAQSVSPQTPAQFKCRVTGTTKQLQYRWNRPGSPSLPPDVRTQDDLLIFHSAAPSHAGDYECEATVNEPEGSQRSPPLKAVGRLNVEAPPAVVVDPPNNNVPEGQPATFTCTVPGQEKNYNYRWARPGQYSLPPGAADRGQQLTFSQVQKADQGEYECLATPLTNPQSPPITGKGRLNVEDAPEVVVDPPVNNVPEGKPATFTCSVPGQEKDFNYRWARLGQKPLPPGAADRGQQLTFSQVQKADQGEYECLATPLANPQSPPLSGVGKLNVEDSPEVVVDPPDNNVPEGQPATFTCSVPGQEENYNYRWARPGQHPLPPGAADRGQQLTFNQVEKSHQGVYECLATPVSQPQSPPITGLGRLNVEDKPELVVEPKTQSVEHGDPASINCRVVNRENEFNYRWSKPGSPELPTNAVDRGQILEFNNFDESCIGKYECQAVPRNDPSASPLRETGDIKLRGSPSLKITPDDQSVIPGKDAEFQCSVVDSSKDYDVKWSKADGSNLPPNAVDNNGILTISQVDQSVTGEYECTATPSDGSGPPLQDKAKLGVDEPAKIRVEPPQQTISEDEDAQFVCTIEGGNTAYNLGWSKPGSQTLPSNAVVRNGQIFIQKASLSDAGDYQCTASPQDPRAGTPISGTGRLDVRQPAAVVITPPQQTVPVGDPAKFQCEVPSAPNQYTLEWAHKGHAFLPSGAYQNNGELVIPTVTKDAAGEYECSAGAPGEPTLTGIGRLDVPEPIAVTVNPKEQEVPENGKAEFTCQVSAQGYDRRWAQQGQDDLPTNAADQGDGRLIVKNVVPANEGTYKCLATPTDDPGAEPLEDTGSLIVKAPPQVRVDPPEKRSEAGEDAEFKCFIENGDRNEDYNLSWDRPGMDSLPRLASDIDGVLTLRDVTTEDEGEYQCTASSAKDGPVASASGKLIVEGQEPTITITPKLQTVPIGDKAEFTCTATGVPQPVVSWSYKVPGSPLRPGVTFQDGVLVIESVREEDGGKYYCIASNSFETKLDDAELFVEKEPPQVEVEPFEKGAQDDEDFEILCTVLAGRPDPTLTWARADGEPLRDDVQDMGDGTLKFTKFQRAAAGQYTCTGTNIAGTSTATSDVTPTGIVMTITPSVGNPNDPVVEVPIGEPVELSCDATGEPEPEVEWTSDVGPLRGDVPDDYVPPRFDDYRVIIDKFSEAHAGTYTCVGANENESKEATIQLVGEGYWKNLQKFQARARSRARALHYRHQ